MNANSRRILNRLTDNLRLTESTEFEVADGGGVLVLRTAKRQFDVVRYRKRAGSQRRAVELAVLFIVKGTGDFYPVRYSVDPPRELDLARESISTQSPDEYEQHELARNMDDWLPNVERSIGRPSVAQAG